LFQVGQAVNRKKHSPQGHKGTEEGLCEKAHDEVLTAFTLRNGIVKPYVAFEFPLCFCACVVKNKREAFLMRLFCPGFYRRA